MSKNKKTGLWVICIIYFGLVLLFGHIARSLFGRFVFMSFVVQSFQGISPLFAFVCVRVPEK